MQVQARIPVGILPYWATTSPDGRYCFVTVSGSNEISVIEYATRQHVKAVPVGRLPQRSRMGRVPEAVLRSLNASAG
jgi:YVTN family beta-propeller protein